MLNESEEALVPAQSSFSFFKRKIRTPRKVVDKNRLGKSLERVLVDAQPDFQIAFFSLPSVQPNWIYYRRGCAGVGEEIICD
jgi:hypothetical protein